MFRRALARTAIATQVVQLAFGPAAPIAQSVPGESLAIIVHQSNPIELLTLGELRRIFLQETQTWPHGRKITVVLRGIGEPERALAIPVLTGMSEPEYERNVLFQMFRGRFSQAPRAIRLASAMQRFVFNAPGAIGYVATADLDGSTKVLRIDGLLPGEAGYPLRIGRVK